MKKNTPTCALITGASQGLGRALARECASRGIDLLLVALPGSGLPEVCRSIEETWNVRAEWLEADLTDPATPERLLSLVKSKEMMIDLLINNAGINIISLFSDSAQEDNEATIELNVLALTRLTRLFVPELLKMGGARILNVGSLGAFFPMPYLPVYSATKSFIVTFSMALREEFAGSIRVSVLCPNTIRAAGPVQDFVERQSLPVRLACMYPEQIAREAINGLLRNKAVIVPGLINRVVNAIECFVPRSLVGFVIRHYWGSYTEAVGITSAGSQSKRESGVKIAG